VRTPVPGSSATPVPAPAPTATPAGSGTLATIPFPPSPDPDTFYAQPSPFPNEPPGTILNSRMVTYAPDGVTMSNAAWQLKFVSRDQNGFPIAAVATVVKPLVAPSGPPNLFLEAFAEDSLGDQCAPSHAVTGSTADTNANLENAVPLTGLTSQSWTVVYPDFEGPYSEYSVNPLGGHITLDSIRAAEQFSPLGLNAKTSVALNGYSGGAEAVSWAATLQHSYAPNLNIVGISSGGTPADLQGITTNIDTNTVANAAFFDIIFMSGVGVNRGYPQFATPILNAKGVAAAEAMVNGCTGDDSNGSSGPTGTFPDYITTLTAPATLAVYQLDGLPQAGEPPVTDMFVYHSQTDELIPIAGADAMVKAWCAEGAHIAYYRALSGDHISTEAINAPFVIAYLNASFSGTTPVYAPTTSVCN
jgi:hypothetical protein